MAQVTITLSEPDAAEYRQALSRAARSLRKFATAEATIGEAIQTAGAAVLLVELLETLERASEAAHEDPWGQPVLFPGGE